MKILISVLVVIILILLIFIIALTALKVFPESISEIKNNDINFSVLINNLTAPILSIITIGALFATFFLQQKNHKEALEEQRKQYESQMDIVRKEHAFNYIDGLFEKFERNLIFNSKEIEDINDYIIKNSETYLMYLKEIKKGNDEIKQFHINEFWTEQEIRTVIQSLYHYISRFNFLYQEIKNQKYLDDKIKDVYIENLKEDFRKISFKKAIDFVYKNEKELDFVIQIFNDYNINRETLY